MLSLEELFCSVDDFCKIFEPLWQKQRISDGHKHRQRSAQLSLSEVIDDYPDRLSPSSLPKFQRVLSRKSLFRVAVSFSRTG